VLRLLREHQVAREFRRARGTADKAIVAVPFWGEGAAKVLGLSERDPVRILCNLSHPGCNPEAIAELRQLHIKVRTHRRLHAKLYAAGCIAIIGSSNVSTNGLNVEGKASKSWIEANVLSDNEELVGSARALFEEIWNDPETRSVRKGDIEDARKARAEWPKSGTPSRPKTLLAACRERPDDFGSVYIAAYNEGLGEGGWQRLEEVQRGARPPTRGLTTSDFRNACGYQYEEVIPEGAWLVDLDCTRKKARVVGCAEAKGLRLEIEGETDLTIAIWGDVRLPGFGARLVLANDEKRSLEKNASRFPYDRLLPLPKAVKIIDRHT
jgi:hypothetical protein